MEVFALPADDPRQRPGFVQFLRDIEGKPFWATLSSSLLVKFPHPEYTWLWTIHLRCRALDPEAELPDSKEMQEINALAVHLFDRLRARFDILFVGTTGYRGNIEVTFVGREADFPSTAAILHEMPSELKEHQWRFLRYHSKRDPKWEALVDVYDVVRKLAPKF